MQEVFTKTRFEGVAKQYLNPAGFQCDTGNISVMAMPPGKVDVTYLMMRPTLCVIPFQPATMERAVLSGTDVGKKFIMDRSSTFYGSNQDLVLQSVNHDWELLIELDPAILDRIDAEHTEGVDLSSLEFASETDPVAAALGQLAITHLKEPLADKLYLEGLATALLARKLSSMVPGRGPASVAGTDRRIDRAIDYIRSDLTGPMTVADLAKVACMSPSWFSRAFRAQTGMTVHAYIQERRLERASLLLQTGTDSLATIAWDCGFADHSHLTRLFRKRYGTTPSAVRAG